MQIHAFDPTPRSARWPGFAAGLLGGAYILGITSQYPISVSPDGTYYLEMARHLQEAADPRIYDGEGNLQLITHWPPFYPLCVAGLGLLLGLDPLSAARILAALVLGSAVVLIDKILLRLAPAPGARGIVLVLLLTSFPFVIFTKALSDAPCLVLLLAMTLLLMRWQENPRSRTLVIAGIFAGLMVLTRYAAVGLVGGAGLFVLSRSVPIPRRLSQALCFGIPVLLLSGAWVAYTLLDGGESNRRSVAFHFIDWPHVVVLIKTILLWLSPAWRTLGFFVLSLLAILGVLLIREKPRFWLEWSAAPYPLFAWLGGMYFLSLLLSITFIDFHTPLNYRILAPTFLFAVFLSLPMWEKCIQTTRTRWWAIVILVSIGLSSLWNFAHRSNQYFQHGDYYTSEVWMESAALSHAGKIPLDQRVYTNGPDPIRLFYRRHEGLFMLPVRMDVVTRAINADFEREMDEVHEELRSGRAVLVYFDAIERRYVPGESDLQSRFPDIPLRQLEDGFSMERVTP